MDDDSFYRMLDYHYLESEDEAAEFCEFNPEALLQGFMNSNAFTLIEIISLIEGKELSNIAYGIWGKDEYPPSYFESDSEESTSIT
ncbi:hypothetical protein Glove_21g9 [Diversispora epigaea]|uniref:Uncharacterized protein n=1 Tax=Diversispora epigaea TaxID=1348612 RepID=A0A397JN91_9GLOM|nr:hypothetical protein Glove_21g9 [Diversispora epigaea]